ncbi:MAG: nuclear transport factor 2 family protein [Verrucomicrobia bacterium]|nr:nuclear transport factor 2 family protein [Verrucomicrobiota bacterium]
MNRVLPLIRLLVTVTALALGGGRAAESAAVAAVRQADAARCAAMMRGDGAALAGLLSEELRFVHSDGRLERKADYVRNLMAGDTEYRDVKISGLEVLEPRPGVVIVIGAQEMRKRLGPTWSEIRLRYLAVWREEGGTWRMYAWQSMRPAGNSTVPAKQ